MTMMANNTKQFGGFWGNRINKCTIEMKGMGNSGEQYVELFTSANVWKGSGKRTLFCLGTFRGATVENFPADGGERGSENRSTVNQMDSGAQFTVRHMTMCIGLRAICGSLCPLTEV